MTIDNLVRNGKRIKILADGYEQKYDPVRLSRFVDVTRNILTGITGNIQLMERGFDFSEDEITTINEDIKLLREYFRVLKNNPEQEEQKLK